MDARGLLDDLALTGAGYAAPVAGHTGVGCNADDLVTPASVMKIQVALTIENAIGAGAIDGSEQRVLTPERRTPGPVGISLMQDEVSMSVRDLVVSMLTISDNVATDELLAVAGMERVNRTTHELGLVCTRITSTQRDMLDGMAAEVGFPSYAPVLLLQAIWRDRAGDPRTCRLVRQLKGQQLTRHRIASGLGPPITVAAKSGGLLGIVRNEAGVVTFPDGAAYAVAVFTRRTTETTTDPALIDAGIGRIARALIDRLRES
jgi:beta-lactamase class A